MFYKTSLVWYKLFDSLAGAAADIVINKARLYTIAGKDICMVRTTESYFAVANKCPHNGFALSKGYCSEDHAIVCPLHRYRFDLKTGRSKSGASASYVETYPVEVRADGVYVGIKERKWNLF
jgi:nitrite reductase/ring-hydroxylating ferredoxin subunit